MNCPAGTSHTEPDHVWLNEWAGHLSYYRWCTRQRKGQDTDATRALACCIAKISWKDNRHLHEAWQGTKSPTKCLSSGTSILAAFALHRTHWQTHMQGMCAMTRLMLDNVGFIQHAGGLIERYACIAARLPALCTPTNQRGSVID